MAIVKRAAFAFGRWNRKRKARFALRLADELRAESALLVGVSGDRNPVNNLIEHELARGLPWVVASGISTNAQGWDPFVVADGRQLPFSDQSFDLVYANAVIEHVGTEADQRRFVEEIARVGRHWVVTTPNRWFPIEAHYHTFFRHWQPGWSKGTVTRLLGIRDFRRLLPSGTVRGVPVVSPTLTSVGRGVPRDLAD